MGDLPDQNPAVNPTLDAIATALGNTDKAGRAEALGLVMGRLSVEMTMMELRDACQRVLNRLVTPLEPKEKGDAMRTAGPVGIEMPRMFFGDILREVASHHGLKVEDLTGESRKRQYVRPRQIAVYIAKRYTTLSYPAIGRRLGGRDHTTALHADRKIKEMIEKGERGIYDYPIEDHVKEIIYRLKTK